MNGIVYLDHNASTPMRSVAFAAMTRAMESVGNPSSVHRFGRQARRIVEDARERVATLVNVSPADVVFTSGGSEANVLALTATGRRRILVSSIEHPSVLAAALNAVPIPVGQDGIVDLAALETLLRETREPALVSVMLANNETGIVQPVDQVADIAQAYGAIVHCDAVQAVGRIPVDVQGLDVQLLSISSHKLGGPPGVGALVVRPDCPFTNIVRGAQERGRRIGTENVPGIAGFGAAAAIARSTGPDEMTEIAELRRRLEAGLDDSASTLAIVGRRVPRLPNTTCVIARGLTAETILMLLDLEGIAVSAGAACSSGKVTVSHVLTAMGVPESQAACAIRISLGWTTTDADVDRFLQAWNDMTVEAAGQVAPESRPLAIFPV